MAQLTAMDGTVASELCFGAMQFGATASHHDSAAMYEAARAAGITFFDTAHAYTEGRSETWLGGFVRAERDRLILATKVGYTGGSGRANLMAQFEGSLRRLGLDGVDILYLHRWDPKTPLEETLETLAELQSRGQVRYLGLSNFAAWQVMKAQWVAAGLGTRIDILQPMYSLVKRQAEVELLPMAGSEGLAVAPYSPLGSGLLTGKYARGEGGRLTEDARYRARYAQDWMHETARALASLAETHGQDPATLAVAWAARHPSVTAPIISARSEGQLAPSLAALGMALEEDLYAQISALAPRPAPATDRLEEGESPREASQV